MSITEEREKSPVIQIKRKRGKEEKRERGIRKRNEETTSV